MHKALEAAAKECRLSPEDITRFALSHYVQRQRKSEPTFLGFSLVEVADILIGVGTMLKGKMEKAAPVVPPIQQE